MQKLLIIAITSTLIACASPEKKSAIVTQENVIQEELIVSKNQEEKPEEKKKVVIEKEGISLSDVADFVADRVRDAEIVEERNKTANENLKSSLPSGSRVNNP